MKNGNAKRRWWLAARNSPLVAGAINLGLAGYVLLNIRPGAPEVAEVTSMFVYLMFGTVMCVPARFVPWYGVRVACLVIGGLPTGFLGLIALTSGTLSATAVAVAVLLVWAGAFGCVAMLGRAWTTGAVARAKCCVNCGYDRRGLGEVVCPECGARDAGPKGGITR